jgi:hypothetical protein
LSCKTKKERLIIDKHVQIQQENRILLKKMLAIDIKHSDLSKQMMKPKIMQVKSANETKGRSKSSMNIGNRINDLRKITDDNRIILLKLSEVKSTFNREKWKKESKQSAYLSNLISQNAAKFSRHPFFDGKMSNPALTFYRNVVEHSPGPGKKSLTKVGEELFRTTMQVEEKGD